MENTDKQKYNIQYYQSTIFPSHVFEKMNMINNKHDELNG